MNQKIQIISILILCVCAFGAYTLSLRPPVDFPVGEKFVVGEGESLLSISKRLEEKNLISSALLFRGWISTIGQDKKIELGIYEFDSKLALGSVVSKIVQGPDYPLLSVTIPEGYTTKEVADAFKKAIPSFSVDIFGELIFKNTLDGYLFPSTYYPLPSNSEEDIMNLMNQTFEKEWKEHFGNLTFPTYVPSRNAIISLAAILEGEAKTEEDMKIVSGILQKRLEKGMRLQVDVAEVTYIERGIPTQPINNPGKMAINAVFYPESSPYLYYLTGNDGKMYYSKTYEEHKRNIEKYLR